MPINQNRAWAEINLSALEHNFDVVQAHANKPVMCIVKANAYGHGAVPVAHRLEQRGAAYFGVATGDEALELRAAGIRTPILILGYVDVMDMPAIVQHNITVPIYDRETAVLFSKAAVAAGKPVKVHFTLDTGMSRLGFPAYHPETTIAQLLEIAQLPGLQVDGAFTHFAVADTNTPQDIDFTQKQLAQFRAICQGLERAGVSLPNKHCANSGGVIQYKDSYFDLVRAGIILYGYQPDPSNPTRINVHPIMTVKTHIVQVRTLEAGQFIGYGCTYQTQKQIREAVIAIGYADGFLRAGSNQASVVVDGQAVPVIGRICMDMLMVHLPDHVQAKRGDIVTVFGDTQVTADTLAQASGTISYEVLCAVSNRIPRIYLS